MNLKLAGIICVLILLQSSCKEKSNSNSCDYYVLGAFYANNNFNTKDSSNHFQQNCLFSFLLKSDTLEVYNRNSKFPNKEEFSTHLLLTKVDTERFIKIVTETSKTKDPNINEGFIYDGLTYVASMNTCKELEYSTANFGIKKEDEDFIHELFEKSEKQKKIKPSKMMLKEKYFMTALLHQTNYIEIEYADFKD